MTAQPLIQPSFFSEQFNTTYRQIMEFTHGISQEESRMEIIAGVNCLNWQVGHVVVARTNFMVILDVPSIWPWDKIKRFVPGSPKISDRDQALSFDSLLAGLDRTQELLVEALDKADAASLMYLKDGQTLAEHLAFYAAHEAGHAGQIELISRLLRQGLS